MKMKKMAPPGGRRLVLCGMILTLLMSGIANAKPKPRDLPVSNDPVLLGPQTEKGLPGQNDAFPGSPVPSPTGLSAPANTDEKNIRVGELIELDPDSIGTLDFYQGGLGEEMWAGTSRQRAQALMRMLPVASQSPFVRQLSRRLLLSSAAAPAGKSDNESLVAQRIGRLYAMGDIEAMRQLIAVAPRKILDTSLRRSQVDGMLLANDDTGACRQVEGGVDDYRELYWRKLRIFCDLLAGRQEMARLGLALLREHEASSRNGFLALVNDVLDNTVSDLSAMSQPTPIYLALARTAQIGLPLSVLTPVDPALLPTIAGDVHTPLPIRIDAAEQAEKLGLFPAEDLQNLYARMEFSNETIGQALLESDRMEPSTARALLLQAARAQNAGLPLARAEVLDALYRQARQHGFHATLARVSAPLLLELEPNDSLIWFAAEAIRALLAADEINAAMSWYSLVERRSDTDARASSAYQTVWPLIQIADHQDRLIWDSSLFESWLAAHAALKYTEEKSLEGNRGKATVHPVPLALALFLGLGESVTGDHWAVAWENGLTLDKDQTAAPVALVNGLRQSAESLRIAETVLLALACLGNDAPRDVHPLVLQEVIRALRHIGLDKDARALALEAALEGGL